MLKRLVGWIGLFALVIGIMVASTGNRLVLAQDDATPTASPEAVDDTGDVVDEEAAPSIVTLVAWYQPDETGEFLELVPLRTSPTFVAVPTQPTEQDLSGVVDFEAERNAGGLPRITLGDSIFDAYPVVPGDRGSVQRWFYFDDVSGNRPGTLVMQVTADRGPYLGATGTATFISRANDSTGVLVIVLYLPVDGAEEEESE